jgi:hypothetical protein
MTTPVSLTPDDDYIPATQRTVPSIDEEYSIDFTETGSDSKVLPNDVKTGVFEAIDGDFLFNTSYTDGTNEEPGDLTGDGAGGRVHELKAGKTYETAQNTEFNKYHAECTALSEGASLAQLKCYPGAGKPNNLE